MSESTNRITTTPYGIFVAGTGLGLYGSGLGFLTAFPNATGYYWSYPGQKPAVEIGPAVRQAISDAGMRLRPIGERAPDLIPGDQYYTKNLTHRQGNAATVDAVKRLNAEFGSSGLSDLRLNVSGKFPQFRYEYPSGGRFNPDIYYRTWSPISGKTVHFDEVKSEANLTKSKHVTQVKQYGRAISEVNAGSAGARVAGRLLQGGGGLISVAGLGYDAFTTYGAINQKLSAGNLRGAGLSAAQFVGRQSGGFALGAASGIGGTLAGAALFGEGGALAGSVVPGLGNIIGGFVGGLVGGVVGAVAGETAITAL